jgi:putative transcriptional regulator
MMMGLMYAELSRREKPNQMKKTATTRVKRKIGDPISGRSDWARVDAMSTAELHAKALADPDAQPLTKEQLAKLRRVSRVKVLRQRLDMTQEQFAAAFRIPVNTLRDWEQRRSVPDAPARALLVAIEKDPKTMQRLLKEEAAAE